MSAFMHRLAVNQVVDAATAIEADHAAEADHATTADSATSADTAANANTLDGKDSSAFISGAQWVSEAYTMTNVGVNSERSVNLDCPGTKFPVAGGGLENGFNYVMVDSVPYFNSLTDRGWKVAWLNLGTGTTNNSGTIWALCADFELTLVPLGNSESAGDLNN